MMKAGKDQGRKKEYRFFTKRVALLAAITLVFTTLGSDIRAFGETYGNVGTVRRDILPTGSIGQVITAKGTEKLTSVSFSLYNNRPKTVTESSNDGNEETTTTETDTPVTVGYTVNVYENVSSVEAASGKNASVTQSSSATIESSGGSGTIDVSFSDSNIYLVEGEPLVVIVTFNNTTDTENGLIYYNQTSSGDGYREKYVNTDVYWSQVGGSALSIGIESASENDIAAGITSISLSADKTYLNKTLDETATLTVSYEPSDSLRVINIETPENQNVISVSPTSTSSTSTITPTGVGTASVQGTIGTTKESKKSSDALIIAVYKPVFIDDDGILADQTVTYTYNGEDQKPNVGFNTGGGTPETATTKTYSDDTKSAGTKTVTFTDSAKNMTGTLQYTINPYNISGGNAITYSEAKFENNSVKSIEIKDTNNNELAEGTDYTVSSIVTGTSTDSDTGKTTVTYTVVVTGQGNYTGTATFTGVVDKNSKTDISKVFSAAVDDSELTYTGESLAASVKENLTFSSLTDENEITLKNGSYELSYYDDEGKLVSGGPVDAGSYTVKIEGRGNYTGELYVDFDVLPMEIEEAINNEPKTIIISFDGAPDNITDEGELKLGDSSAVYYINGDHKVPNSLGGGVGPVISSIILSSTGSALSEDFYDISYSNNKKAGRTGNLTITGHGNFTGDAVYEFSVKNDFNTDLIVKLSGLEKGGTVSVTPDESGIVKNATTYTYNGSNRVPKINTVKLGSNTLREGTHYTVEHSENVKDAGGYEKDVEHYILIKGKERSEYEGKEVKIYYTISPLKISDNNATLTVTPKKTISYTGAEHNDLSEFSKFELKVDGISNSFVISDPGNTGSSSLNNNFYIDESSFSNNIDAGQASLEAVGKGNLEGSVTGYFTIEPLDINDSNIKVTLDKAANGYPYTGSEIKPVVTLSYGNTELSSSDFAVTASKDNILPGEGEIIISGDKGKSGNLTGERTQPFTITEKNLDKINYTYKLGGYDTEINGDDLKSAYEGKYTGQQIRPTVSISDGTKTLKSGQDFTVKYEENVACGEGAYAYVKGIGGYGGDVKIFFSITPLSLGDGSKTIKRPEDNISSSYNVATGDVTVTSYFGVTSRYPATKYSAGYGPALNSIGIKLGGENGTPLTAGTDFEIVPYSSEGGSDDLFLASPYLKTARVEGKGNYTGFFYIQYTVGDNISGGSFELSATSENGITGPTNGYYKVPYGVSPDSALLLKYGDNDLLKTDSENEKASYTVTYLDKDGNEIAVGNLAGLPAGTNVTVQANAIAENGRYYGTKELKYTVAPADASISFKDWDTAINKNGTTVIEKTYDGSEFETKISPSGETSLTLGTDYFIDGGGEQVSIGINAGTEKAVTISFSENYSNSDIKVTYKINPRDISGATISAIEDQTYEGSAVKPRPTVTVNEKTLTLNTDYTLSYENNNTVTDNASVTVKAQGNYTGEKTVTFKITKFDISKGALVIGDIRDVVYDGNPNGQEPNLDITLNGRSLTTEEKENITITYPGDKNKVPGRATVRVEWDDKTHTGTVEKEFNIIGDISNKTLYDVVSPVSDFELSLKNTGKFELNNTPQITATEKYNNNTTTKTSMKDYIEIDYSALETMPGSRSIIIKGVAPYYTGQRSIDVNVYGKLSDAKISAPEYLVYKGDNYYEDSSTVSCDVIYNGKVLPSEIYSLAVKQNEMNVEIEAVAKDAASYYKGKPDADGNTNVGDGSVKAAAVPVYYDLQNATINLSQTVYAYDGEEKKPTVTVTAAGKVLSGNEDYSVKYINNVNASTSTSQATVEISAKTKVSIGGPRQAYFTINQVEGDKFTLSPKPDGKEYTYVGTQIRPSFTVSANSRELVENTDYTVTYGENKEVGSGSVIITGINNYSGTHASNFTITKKSIGTGDVNPDSEIKVVEETKKVQYSKNHNLPDFSIVYSPEGYSTYRLVEGTDYVAEMASGSTGNQGENTAIISADKVGENSAGAKNFSGFFMVKYTVTKADISSYTYETGELTREYDGNETTLKDIKKNIKVTDPDGKELTEGTDCSVSFNGSTNDDYGVTAEGDYPIIISGTGNYDGSISLTYSITKRSIENENNITATYTRALEYTGSEVTINDLKLIDKGLSPSKKLVLGTDYTIDYKYDNTSAGQKTAYLTGIGSYTGSRKIEYTIGEDINNLSGELTTKSTFNYTGHAQAPTGVRLSGADGKPLAVINTNTPNLTLETRDGTFTMSYENKDSVNAGTYKITVAASGTGKYFGEKVLTYEIKPVYVSQSDITVSMDRSVKKDSSGNYSFEYTGSEITPPVVVTYKPSVGSPITLAEGTDYYVEYGSTGRNNIDVGGPIPIKVTTYKTGNFSNELSVSGPVFYITGIETGAGYIELYDGDTYEYTGSEIRPYIYRIFDGLGNEIYDGEYEIVSETYENNIYPGTATLTLVLGGNGNYSGTLTKEFRIVAGLTPSNISDIPDQFYTGTKIEPPVTVRIGDIVLTEGVDYTVSYSSNNEYNSSGIATVTLLSTGQYYNYLRIDEPLEKTFRIVKDTSALTVRIADTYTYTGRDIVPLEGEESVIFKPDGTSVSYTVDKYLRKNESSGTYSEMTTPDLKNVGYIRAELSVDVNGSTLPMTVYYEIIKRAISSTDIKSLENTVYTGNENTPATYLTYNGIVLEKGTDYEASYLNNTYPGTATVRITGLNNFTGTVNKYFKITVPDVTGLKSTGDTSSVTLSWNKNNRISGYLIYSADGRTIYADVKGNTYKKTNLTAGSDYSFGVVPYVEVNGKRTYGNMATLESSTVVSVPSITPGTVSSGQSGAAVTFSTVNGINYKVFRATSKNGTYSHIATVPSSMKNYVDTKAVSGRTYYYRVQAVKILSDGTVVKSELSSPVAVTAK